jgi:uncharacterized protein (DUF362 family)
MPEVAVIRGNAYKATAKALKILDFKKLIKNKRNIVIKPNLTTAATASEGITTDVNVIRAVLDQVSRPEEIIIAEGPGGAETDKAFRDNGYHKLEKEYGLKLVDTKSDEAIEVRVKNPLALKTIKMSKTVYDSDFLISAAKLKIHCIAKVTGTIKNMMGACSNKEKAKIHAFIPKSLVDLNKIKPPDFGIIDGIVANEINEVIPHPLKMGIILASKDCTALDSVATEIMGVDPKEVFYIQRCGEIGLGTADMKKIQIIGENIESVKRKFKIGHLNPIMKSQRLIMRIMLGTGLYIVYRKLRYGQNY